MSLTDDQKTLAATRDRQKELADNARRRAAGEQDREREVLAFLESLPGWPLINASAQRLTGIRAYPYELGTLKLRADADVAAVFQALPPVQQVYWKGTFAGFCPTITVPGHKEAGRQGTTLDPAGLFHVEFDRQYTSDLTWWTQVGDAFLKVEAHLPKSRFAFKVSKRDRANNPTAYELDRCDVCRSFGRVESVRRSWYSGSQVQESRYSVHFRAEGEPMALPEALEILNFIYGKI